MRGHEIGQREGQRQWRSGGWRRWRRYREIDHREESKAELSSKACFPSERKGTALRRSEKEWWSRGSWLELARRRRRNEPRL